MKNILTEALVNSATNASFIFSYTNSAKLRFQSFFLCIKDTFNKLGYKTKINTHTTSYIN